MKYTNNSNLPLPDFNAIVHDEYQSSGDVSVTQLIAPVRANILRARHKDEIVVDVNDRMQSMIGRAIDEYVEKHCGECPGYTHHTRMNLELPGDFGLGRPAILSGEYDLLFRGNKTILYDRKKCSVWAYILGGKEEWVLQDNAYAYMLRKQGVVVDELHIIAYFTDWKDSDFQRNPEEYPPMKNFVFPIPMKSTEETEAWIVSRAHEHISARGLDDNKLPLCSEQERWCRGGAWAVYRMTKGKRNQKADKVFKMEDGKTEEQANAYCNELLIAGNESEVVHRPPRNRRCESFCEAREFCDFYQKYVKQDASSVFE